MRKTLDCLEPALEVLLLSPLPGHDPSNGDASYTESLVSNPPEGIRYTNYIDALAAGDLVEHGRRSSLEAAVRARREVLREVGRTTFLHATGALRKRHVLTWEPHRFFSVRRGRFDLVHLHVFSAGFLQLPCPLVVSNGASARDLYRNARGYSAIRTSFVEKADRALGGYKNVNLNSYFLPDASEVWCFSEHLRDWYRTLDFAEERLAVMRPFIDGPDIDQPPRPRPHRVGFVAQAFELKGGKTFLDAWRTVRDHRPDAEAVIAGCEARLSDEECERLGITWLGRVERSILLDEVFPSLDVFAYPSEWDGFPLTPIEALSRSLPVVISDYGALPEIVDHGKAGLVTAVGNAEQLASSLLAALDPHMNETMRARALARFRSTFSSEAGRRAHRDGYLRILDRRRHSDPTSGPPEDRPSPASDPPR